jgi:hypothetical protein
MAQTLQTIQFPGYPGASVAANRMAARGQHFGSNNYQVGGYNITAQSLGMQYIEMYDILSFAVSNNYYARPNYPNTGANNAAQAVPPTYVTLKWYYAANNNEVANNTNLNAEYFIFDAQGV